MSNPVDFKRSRRKLLPARFTLDDEAFQYDVDANHSLFKSGHEGATNFDLDRGQGDGTRFNITIIPDAAAIWVQFSSTSEEGYYVHADRVYEEFNVQASNLFITSAAETTAQIENVITPAESSGNYESGGIGTYFKLYARDATTFVEVVYGVWFDTDNGSTQPTDTEVDTFVEIDISVSDGAGTISAAVQSAVGALTEFSAVDNTGDVDITHAASGARQNAANVDSPCTVSTTTEGAGSDTTVTIKVV